MLRTVIDHYPIQGHAPAYPSKSIRQIPGAFEGCNTVWPAESLTLDDIEKKVLPEFHDPRVYLALGRGAVGSGRLRSEAYVPARIETQLSEMAAECTSRPVCAQIDRSGNKVLGERHFLVAREGVRGGVWRQGAGRVRQPQPHRARHPVPRRAAALRGAPAPRPEYLPGRLRALRLVAERPHRPRRTLAGPWSFGLGPWSVLSPRPQSHLNPSSPT